MTHSWTRAAALSLESNRSMFYLSFKRWWNCRGVLPFPYKTG
jgi:hypothetical protein